MTTEEPTTLKALLSHPDVLLAVFVVGVVGMMIVPMPPALVDVLIAANLTASVLILVVTLFARSALAVSSYPTLLLITTLFRLGLNLSTTRLILGSAHAGAVVTAFGEFVVGGDLVVGLVMFLVLTLVQFLVIAKGAERVSEVGARFTLDAMPGKQMSIEAAVRAGSIDEREAERRREDLGRESQLFAAMDGAMKFVKGDAIAGLIITALNLVAGMIIGVSRDHLSIGDAAQLYTVLSVGDALVSQVPALLIALSAGVVTTRVAPRAGAGALGGTLAEELFGNPLVLLVAGVLAAVLALVPGLPFVPFAVLAAGLGGGFFARHRQAVARAEAKRRSDAERASKFREQLESETKKGKALRSVFEDEGPVVAPIAIELGSELVSALGAFGGAAEALRTAGNDVRNRVFMSHGVQLPGFAFRIDGLPAPRLVVVRLRGVPALMLELPGRPYVAFVDPERLARLGVEAEPFSHPSLPMKLSAVAAEDRALVESSGVLCEPLSIMIAQLGVVAAQGALASFVGLQQVSDLVSRLEKVAPALVRETVPKLVDLPLLTELLRRLVEEGVSIRDLPTILGALAQCEPARESLEVLVDHVRQALSSQIGYRHAPDGVLRVIQLDPALEDTLESALCRARGGQSVLALEPELASAVLDRAEALARQVQAAGAGVVFVCRPQLRRPLWDFLRPVLRTAAVLSYGELPPNVRTPVVGRLAMAQLAA
jgi:type III secretion protein V